MQLSPVEIFVVAAIALIVLGPERLPKAARQLGRAIGEIKNFSSGVQSQVQDAIRDPAELAAEKTEQWKSNPDTGGFQLIDVNSDAPNKSKEDEASQ